MTDMQRDKIIGAILSMSDRAVDPQLKKMLQPIIGQKPSEQSRMAMLKALDMAVHCAWCSEVEIMAMDECWLSLGGSDMDYDKAEWRKSVP